MRCTITVILLALTLIGGLPAGAETIRIGTWNIKWLFDHDPSDDSSGIGRNFAAPSQAKYIERITAVADAIQEMDLTILGLQEIENAKVVQDIADDLQTRHGLAFRVAFVQGRDTHTGQDVAFLLRQALPGEARRFPFDAFDDDDSFKRPLEARRAQHDGGKRAPHSGNSTFNYPQRVPVASSPHPAGLDPGTVA